MNSAVFNLSGGKSLNSARILGKALGKRNMTLAVAESCTGGMVGGAITAVPGSSRYFAGGVIVYEDRVKRRVLKVPASLLKRYGAVSRPAVIAMARGVKRLFKTDCAIAVSGVAGPGGGTRGKPVGLVFIAAAVNNTVHVSEARLKGNRGEIRRKAVETSLKQLINLMK
ncbi:MAG: CinA family protein [Chitinispirillaceae bacterium]|nr:CinA family protein [Chitinispirillaceae bacterium]